MARSETKTGTEKVSDKGAEAGGVSGSLKDGVEGVPEESGEGVPEGGAVVAPGGDDDVLRVPPAEDRAGGEVTAGPGGEAPPAPLRVLPPEASGAAAARDVTGADGAGRSRAVSRSTRLTLYVSRNWYKGLQRRAKYYEVAVGALVRDAVDAGIDAVLVRYERERQGAVSKDEAFAAWEPPAGDVVHEAEFRRLDAQGETEDGAQPE